AQDHPHRGGLAGAVRAEKARHGSGADVKAEVVHGGRGAVALDQAACLDHEIPPSWCEDVPGPRPAGTVLVDLHSTPGIRGPARSAAATRLRGGVSPRVAARPSPAPGDTAARGVVHAGP